jgi:flagellar basal-body rod protein FlgG
MVNFSVAVSALRAAFDRQANTSNNIANLSTPGFKSRRVHLQETLNGGVRTAAVSRDISQGPLEPTGRPLDVAVSGRGFLAVETPKGQRFTRFGVFGLDAAGRIVDPGGNRLSPGITVPDNAVAVDISRDGAVSATMPDGTRQQLGTIELYTFANPHGLQAMGDGLFSPTASSGAPGAFQPGAPGAGQVIAGFLEGSNVSLPKELTDQIVSKASLSAGIASIRAQDDMLGELLDTVG